MKRHDIKINNNKISHCPHPYFLPAAIGSTGYFRPDQSCPVTLMSEKYPLKFSFCEDHGLLTFLSAMSGCLV